MVNTTTQGMATNASRKIDAETKVSGLAGVFKRLAHDHSGLTKLLRELRMSSDPALRERLFPAVRDAVMSHERAESQIVYAAMSKKAQTRLIAAKHTRTAGELECLVERLRGLDYSSARWESTFVLLFEAFEQHTIEEESYHFPIAQRVLGDAKSEALIAEYEVALGSREAPAEAHGSDELSYARAAVRAAVETRRGRSRTRQ